MAKPRHLQRAPITEAVMELRVIEAGPVDAEVVRSFGAKCPRFTTEPQKQVQHTLSLGPEGPSARVEDFGIRSLRLVSPDGRNVAQISTEAYAHSRLAPYTQWADLRRDTAEVWEVYRAIMRPMRVVRIGVRFLNRLELPLPIANLKVFLEAPPQVPPGALPQLNTFVTRVVTTSGDGARTSSISQAVIETADPNRISLVLDIDVAFTRPLSPDDTRIWDEADHLRALKNDVFFGSITEETVRMYE